uniref:Transmembrane protein n=2 Tax=Bursaphelenchus xylophilus TaxID=6326 RepID=A0A1I7SSB6_BURXY
MAEVGQRYVEQFQTTVETMRRRGLAIYDYSVKVSNSLIKTAERAYEVAEPAAYDFLDHLVQACSDDQLDLEDKENRNNILELYLALCVLMVGISSGELMGAFVLCGLVEALFDTWVQIALLGLVPSYVYLSFRKNAALDDTEKRVWMFGCCLSEGILLGNLIGYRLISTVPGAFFVVPLVLGLLADSEFSPVYVCKDRTRLIGFSCAVGVLASIIFSIIPAGYCSSAVIWMSGTHIALLFAHYQMVAASMKNKTFGNSEAMFGYVFPLLGLQLIICLFFGTPAPQ